MKIDSTFLSDAGQKDEPLTLEKMIKAVREVEAERKRFLREQLESLCGMKFTINPYLPKGTVMVMVSNDVAKAMEDTAGKEEGK